MVEQDVKNFPRSDTEQEQIDGNPLNTNALRIIATDNFKERNSVSDKRSPSGYSIKSRDKFISDIKESLRESILSMRER